MSPTVLVPSLVFQNQQAIKTDSGQRFHSTGFPGPSSAAGHFLPTLPWSVPRIEAQGPTPWSHCDAFAPSTPAPFLGMTTGERLVLTHRARAGLPEEGLEVSSCHELQQDKSGQGLQAHPNTAHDVLVVEFAAGRRGVIKFN